MNNVQETDMIFAQKDAEVFLLLASFYNINPDKETVSAMTGLIADESGAKECVEAINKVRSIAEKVAEEEGEALIIEIKKDWTKLFRGVAPNYGPKAPYEELFLRKRDPKHLKMLTDLYLEAGYSSYVELKNRQDYIGVQLEFVGTLGLLRENALVNDDIELYSKLTETSEKFIRDHISSWFGAFYKEAQEHVQTDYFRGVLDLTLLLVG